MPACWHRKGRILRILVLVLIRPLLLLLLLPLLVCVQLVVPAGGPVLSKFLPDETLGKKWWWWWRG
jgi:hypothetical protein